MLPILSVRREREELFYTESVDTRKIGLTMYSRKNINFSISISSIISIRYLENGKEVDYSENISEVREETDLSKSHQNLLPHIIIIQQ